MIIASMNSISLFLSSLNTPNCDLSKMLRSARCSVEQTVGCSRIADRVGILRLAKVQRFAAGNDERVIVEFSWQLQLGLDEVATVAFAIAERTAAVSFGTEVRSVVSGRLAVELELEAMDGKLLVVIEVDIVAVEEADTVERTVGFSDSVGIRYQFVQSIDTKLNRNCHLMDCTPVVSDRWGWNRHLVLAEFSLTLSLEWLAIE